MRLYHLLALVLIGLSGCNQLPDIRPPLKVTNAVPGWQSSLQRLGFSPLGSSMVRRLAANDPLVFCPRILIRDTQNPNDIRRSRFTSANAASVTVREVRGGLRVITQGRYLNRFTNRQIERLCNLDSDFEQDIQKALNSSLSRLQPPSQPLLPAFRKIERFDI